MKKFLPFVANGNKKTLLLAGISLGIVVLIALAYFLFVLPLQRSDLYLQQIDPQVADLKKQADTLSKSTRSAVFNTPDLTHEQKKNALAAIKVTIQQTNQKMDAAEKTNNTLSRYPVAETFGLLKESTTMHRELPYTFSQSREVTSNYATLVDYLEKRNDLDAQLSDIFRNFNAISSYDELIGNSSELSDDKAKIDNLHKQFQSLKVPAGMEKTHSQAEQTYAQGSVSFQKFIDALATRSELTIDVAAHGIERVTEQHETADSNAMFDALITLPVLEDVADMNEKFDRY